LVSAGLARNRKSKRRAIDFEGRGNVEPLFDKPNTHRELRFSAGSVTSNDRSNSSNPSSSRRPQDGRPTYKRAVFTTENADSGRSEVSLKITVTTTETATLDAPKMSVRPAGLMVGIASVRKVLPTHEFAG